MTVILTLALSWFKQRGLNARSLAMIGTVAVIALGSFGIYKASSLLRDAIVAKRDLHWQRNVTTATETARAQAKEADRKAAEAIERERAANATAEALRERATALERMLAGDKDDPEILPRKFVQEMRK